MSFTPGIEWTTAARSTLFIYATSFGWRETLLRGATATGIPSFRRY